MPHRTAASDSLLTAIRAHDDATVRAILSETPDARTHLGSGGESLVLHACYLGATELAPLLRGERPYDACEAAALGDLEALNAALDRNADLISLRSSDGWTPLHLAGFFGHEECAAYLIDNGAPLDAHSTNAIRNTPLHAALAGKTNVNIVRRLVFAGADVNARGENGVLPLHLAASRGNQLVCDLLIARGADAQAAMDDGTTPAALAEQRGFAELSAHLGQQREDDSAS
jgi:ankyrin repeat protein